MLTWNLLVALARSMFSDWNSALDFYYPDDNLFKSYSIRRGVFCCISFAVGLEPKNSAFVSFKYFGQNLSPCLSLSLSLARCHALNPPSKKVFKFSAKSTYLWTIWFRHLVADVVVVVVVVVMDQLGPKETVVYLSYRWLQQREVVKHVVRHQNWFKIIPQVAPSYLVR